MNILSLLSLLLASSLTLASPSAISTRIRGSQSLQQAQTQAQNELSDRQRHLQQGSSCTLYLKCITYGPTEEHPHGRDEHHWVCKLSKEDAKTFNVQFIDIIESEFLAPFLADAVTGSSIMTMTDAIIDIKNPQMFIPEDAIVQVHTHRFERKGADVSEGRYLGNDRPVRPTVASAAEADEKGPTTIGRLRTLVIRLTDGDNVPVTASIDKLKDDVFDDGASLKTQTEACSYGKLNIVPFEGNTPSNKYISNGIVDIKMDYRMTSDEPAGRDQAALAAAKDQLGDLDDDMFDLILVCFPPGGGNFGASAFPNSKYSFYNDKWCSFVSSQMHEVGHNLGLGHSGEGEAAYGDSTGIMGSSFELDDQHFCYNPQKSYQLGWYDDKVDTINPLDGVPRREFTLNGVSDYEKNNDALIALRLKQVHIENKDYYIGFNRADGINQDTREDPNMVTISRKEEGDADEYGQSTKVASLNPGERYVIQDFDNRKDITIAFIGLKNWDARIVVLEGDNQVPPPPGDCQKFTIEMTTDEYPEDTLWYITDTGDIGYVGGFSPVYTQQFMRKDTQVCLPMGKSAETYEFTIIDRNGDGLTKGEVGSYKIRDDSGQVVVSEDDNTAFEFRTHYLEVRKDPNPPPPTKAPTQAPTAKPTPTPPCETYTVEVLTDTFPEDTSWQFVGFNHYNEDFIFDEKSGYEHENHLHKDTVCLPQGKTYKFRVSDKYEDGLCCGAGYGYYRLIDSRGNVIVDSGMKEDAFEVNEYTIEVDNLCQSVTDKSTDKPTKAPVVVSNPSSDAQCEDERKEKEKFRVKEDGAKNTCQIYGSKNKCDQMITTGKNENRFVWEVCKNSCNRCGNSPSINNVSAVPLSASNNNKCNDEKKEKLKFRIKDGGKKSTCKVYADKGKCDTVITTGKSKNKKVWEVCKNSCNKC